MTVPPPPEHSEPPSDERPEFVERVAAFIAGLLGTVFLAAALFSGTFTVAWPVVAVALGVVPVIGVAATRRASRRKRALYGAAAAGIATVLVLWGGCLAMLSTVHIRN